MTGDQFGPLNLPLLRLTALIYGRHRSTIQPDPPPLSSFSQEPFGPDSCNSTICHEGSGTFSSPQIKLQDRRFGVV